MKQIIMEQIGMFDAKTRFSEIVEQVLTTGQPVTVTNRGKPVVDIIPTHVHTEGRMSREEAFERVAEIRKRVAPVTHEEVRKMIDYGRQ